MTRSIASSATTSSPGAGAVLARTWEGVAIVFADRRLGAIMAVTVIYNVFAWPFTSMIPVIGTGRLLLGPEGVGLLTSVDGIGAFAGALVLALWLVPGWHARAYVGGVAAYLVGLIAFALAPTPLLAGAALFALFPTIRENRDRMKQIEPMLEEADRLALDYDKVLSGGGEYVGKYVLWCVQNRGEEAVSYKGDPGRRLAVSNFPAMPLVSGSKHESCSDMLLKVKSGNAANGVVTVRFMHNFK